MKSNWRLVVAFVLAAVLCLPASMALGGPIPCSGRDCFKAPGGVDRAGVEAWIAQNGIKDLSADHWAAGPIVDLALSGALAVGKGDAIRPDAPATLWQAARLIMVYRQQSVADLTPREIAQKAADLKLIPGPLAPQDRTLTRLEAGQLAAGLAGFTGTVKPESDLARVFTDWSAVPQESQGMVYWVTIQYRLFVGFPDHTLRPGEGLTLAQLAVLAQRMQDIVFTPPAPPPLNEP